MINTAGQGTTKNFIALKPNESFHVYGRSNCLAFQNIKIPGFETIHTTCMGGSKGKQGCKFDVPGLQQCQRNVFTTGPAKLNPKDYAIKCVGVQ